MNRLRHSHTWAALGLLLFGPLSFVFGVMDAFAQERKKMDCKDVPASVRKTLADAYPKVVIKACSEELHFGQTVYEIETTDGNPAHEIVFAPDGKLIGLEQVIATAQLPEPVQQALYKEYPNREVVHAEALTTDDTIAYEFHLKPLKRGRVREQAVFDTRGNELTPLWQHRRLVLQ